MRLILIVLLFIMINNIAAQSALNPKQIKVIEAIMERFIETSETGVDYSDLQTQLEELMVHKINLNNATLMDLSQLIFLGSTQISVIIRHKEKYGAFLSIYELQAIEGLSDDNISLLTNFVTIDESDRSDHDSFWEMLAKGKQEIIYLHEQELQHRKGYLIANDQAKRYLGNPYREVLRYRFNYNKRLAFGYSAEKDKGEKYGNTPASFFDFNTFYLFYKGKKYVKNIAIGDFQANMGKGLTFGSGMATRKSAMVLNSGSFYETFRPYRSINESGFLRGAAITLSLKKLSLSMFASSTKISSTINYDSFAEPESISAIALNGLHRTPNEIAKRNNASQRIAGFNIEFLHQTYKVGLIYILSAFSIDKASGNKPYKFFEKPESLLRNIGTYGQLQVRNVSLYGEFSRSSNGGLAGFCQALIPLHPKMDFLVLYRNYGTSYQTVFANAFSEYGGCKNEQGVYMALAVKLTRSLQLNMYADLFSSPWLRYLVNAPSSGQEYLVSMQYNPSKTLQFEIRFKYEEKPRNMNDNVSKLDYLINRQRQTIRLQMQFQLNRNLSLKTRLEQVFFDKPLQPTQTGILFFQDVHAKLFSSKLGLTLRMAWFDIKSFDARVYATETDVLYNYAIPQFQNEGWRFYILLDYKLTPKTVVYIKYGQTTYSNVNTIGTGLDAINGNTLQELKVQLRMVF